MLEHSDPCLVDQCKQVPCILSFLFFLFWIGTFPLTTDPGSLSPPSFSGKCWSVCLHSQRSTRMPLQILIASGYVDDGTPFFVTALPSVCMRCSAAARLFGQRGLLLFSYVVRHLFGNAMRHTVTADDIGDVLASFSSAAGMLLYSLLTTRYQDWVLQNRLALWHCEFAELAKFVRKIRC